MDWTIILNVMIGLFLYGVAVGIFRALLGSFRRYLRELDRETDDINRRAKKFENEVKERAKILGFVQNDKEG